MFRVFDWLVLLSRSQASKDAEIRVLVTRSWSSAARWSGPGRTGPDHLAALTGLLPAALRGTRLVKPGTLLARAV